jgi:HAMP domain-containing protein
MMAYSKLTNRMASRRTTLALVGLALGAFSGGQASCQVFGLFAKWNSNLSKIRSRSEARAKLVKGKFSGNAPQRLNTERLYGDAKSSADAWIDYLKSALASASQPNINNINTLQAEAGRDALALWDYVDTLFGRPKGASQTLASIASQMGNAVVDFLSKWQSNSDDQVKRQALMQELEAMRFQDFGRLN